MSVSADLNVMKRLLLCEANTFAGQRICERFDRTGEWYVTATRRAAVSPDCGGGDAENIAGVHQWVPSYAGDAAVFKQYVLEADVIVCPLSDNTEEAFAAIRMLSNTAFDTEKTFVLVSSVMTWADTHLAERTIAAAERKAERDAAIAAGEEVPDEEEEETPGEPEETPTFTEDQYQRRVPHRRYDRWKELEHFTKHVNSETLHTYVLFSGVPYGCGEDLLHRYFRAAYHAQPLPMITDGSNKVPLIHVKDLASAVFKVGTATDVLPQRYIFAVDKGNHSYGQVVSAINERLGTGQTVPIPPARHHTQRSVEQLTVDLKAEPSAVYDIVEDEEWVCPEGFVAGIDRIVAEYLQYRNVTPVRLVLLGPPESGKSVIAAEAAKEFKLPHLRAADMIEAYRDYIVELKAAVKKRRAERKEARRLAAVEEARRAAEEAAAETAAAAAEAGQRKEEEGEGGEDEPPRLQSTMVASDDGQNASLVDDFQVEFATEAPPPEGTVTLESEQPGEADGNQKADEEAAANANPPGEDEEKDEPEDEEDEMLIALKERIAAAEKTIQTTVAPLNASPPTDEEGNPIEPPTEVSPRRLMLGKPYGEAEAASTTRGTSETKASAAGASEQPPRLRPAALATIVRWRISQRDCRAQGYVLDGYPKSVRDAAMLFSAGEIPLPDAQEPDPVDEDASVLLAPVDDKLLPEFVGFLDGKEDLFRGRAAAKGVEGLARYYRRRKQYAENHTAAPVPHKSLVAWFRAILTNKEGAPRETSVRIFDVSDADEGRTMASCREWIGVPHYYRPTPSEILREAQQQQLDEERSTIERLRAEEEALRVSAAEAAAKRQERAKHERRYTSIQHEQTEAAAIQSMPMQTYLMQFVVPALTKGIAHCVSLRPADPVDSLADYLFQHTAKRSL